VNGDKGWRQFEITMTFLGVLCVSFVLFVTWFSGLATRQNDYEKTNRPLFGSCPSQRSTYFASS